MEVQFQIRQTLFVDSVLVMLETRQRSAAGRAHLLDCAILADESAYAALDMTPHIASLSTGNGS